MNYEKAAPLLGTWARHFKPFIESEDMDNIFRFLKHRSKEGKTVCPHHSDIFRAFTECPYEELKCVLVGQDPYPWVYDGSYAADGLCFSSRNTGKIEPSLDEIYHGMEQDLCGGFNLKLKRNPDLSYLARQGVLLLNSALSCEKDHIGVHAPAIIGTKQYWVWDAFMHFLFRDILNMYNPTVIVFMGSQARRYSRDPVPFHHDIIEVEHPAACRYSGKPRRWKHEHVFSRINHLLKLRNGPEAGIKWFEEEE